MDLTQQPITRLPFRWKPGEHMTIVGDTGSGKSTLAERLTSLRQFLIVMRTKPDKVRYQTDITVRRSVAKYLQDKRYRRIEIYPQNKLSQAHEFSTAFETAFHQGGWTIYVDELFYVDTKLGLGEELDELLTQGRSKGLTVVSGMQRPVQVTRFAMAESMHLLSFGLEGRDVKILREVAPRLAEVVPELSRYEFAWYYRPTKQVWVGTLQDLQHVEPGTESEQQSTSDEKGEREIVNA